MQVYQSLDIRSISRSEDDMPSVKRMRRNTNWHHVLRTSMVKKAMESISSSIYATFRNSSLLHTSFYVLTKLMTNRLSLSVVSSRTKDPKPTEVYVFDLS